VASWRRVNRMGMGNSAIKPRPITSLASPGALARLTPARFFGDRHGFQDHSRPGRTAWSYEL